MILEGNGDSKKEAFANAMSSTQKAINEGNEGYVIRIEPLEVEFVEGKEYISYEKFMFLFMKRKISRFYVKLKVKVRCFIASDNLNYEEIYLKGNLISIPKVQTKAENNNI